MTTIRMTVDPHQTPEEEAQMVARVGAAVAETTGSDQVRFELTRSEDVSVSGAVADRMGAAARWSA